jgi:hypothetical protein
MFKKDRIIIAIIEKLKNDIEIKFPEDLKALKLINDLLHYFCWNLYEKEKKQKDENERSC